MDAIRNFKEKILRDYERMTLDDTFTFACHNKISCFNQCCQDINIFLTPYDILRLKNRLGITSAEFLSKYTLMPVDKNLTYPVLQLKMNENNEQRCHFVRKEGCSVYSDRPWPCRMYPVGSASPGGSIAEEHFYFLMKEDVCEGFKESKKWTIRGWLEDQDVAPYEEFGELFKEVAMHRQFTGGQSLTPKKMQMFFTACYNMEEFHDFVFKSSFLDRFDVDAATLKKIESSEEELLKFGFKWLQFALFAEPTMKIKSNVP